MGGELDRAAVERILHRATELAGASGGADGTATQQPPDDGISVEAVVVAGTEVGIPERALRRAVAIERLGALPAAAPALDRLVGPAVIVDERFVTTPPDELLGLLDEWLIGVHQLRRIRSGPRSPGANAEGEWVRRDDPAAALQRGVRGLTGDGRLGEAAAIIASAVPVGDGTVAIRLGVDRRRRRTTSLAVAGGSMAVAAACATVGIAATAPIGLLAIPGVAVAGVAAANSRSQARRLQRETARLLVDVEGGERPAGLITGIARRLGSRAR